MIKRVPRETSRWHKADPIPPVAPKIIVAFGSLIWLLVSLSMSILCLSLIHLSTICLNTLLIEKLWVLL